MKKLLIASLIALSGLWSSLALGASTSFQATLGSGAGFAAWCVGGTGASCTGGVFWPGTVIANSSGTELFTSGNAAYVQFPSAQAVTATQSSTWTVQPGNTPNTVPWLFTINQGGNSAAVKAASTAAATTDAALVTQNAYEAALLGTPGQSASCAAGSNSTLIECAYAQYAAVTAPIPPQTSHGVNIGGVEGLAAAGAAVAGNPVQIGGSDGTDSRALLTDSSGRPNVVGAAAAGSAVAGNPVLMGGSDGTDVRAIATDTSGHPITITQDTRPSAGSITVIDSASTAAAGYLGVSVVTGTPTASSFVTQAVNGLSVNRFQLSGTWTGTISFEQSMDGGTTWETLGCHVNGTDFNSSNATANGIFDCQSSGATNIRARATATMTGTATVTMTITATPGIMRVLSEVTPATPYHLIAANSNNSTNLKTTAGLVADVQTGNINGSTPYYLKLYDKATAPTCGTDTPVKTILIPPVNSGNNPVLPIGIKFLLGLGFCVTAGIADNDNTSVPAATVIVNIDYK